MTTHDARDILTLALTGTRHSGRAAPQTTSQLDQLAPATGASWDEAERELLLRAGAWAAYRRAGYLPLPAPEPPAPAPTDARPACSPAAGEAVATLLRGRRFDLLPEALARLRAAGLRLPPALLPLALSTVGLTTELHAELIPALGERGRWLARFNPAWAWATELPDEADDDPASAPEEHWREVWDEGKLRQRVAVLRRLRRRDPATARDLLAAEWKHEKAEARAALLAALAIFLSPEDEPLLNQALTDRSEHVRGAAIDLLARLPDSAVGLRMRRRATAALAFSVESLGAAAALFPADDDEGMRDSLVDAFDNRATGVSATLDTLQYVPPEYWEVRFDLSPDQLIVALEGARWRTDILRGWTAATQRFGSAHWAAALWIGWTQALAAEPAPHTIPVSDLFDALARQMPIEEQRRLAIDMIASPDTYPHVSLAQILACLPRPWDGDVADVFLREFGRTLEHVGASMALPHSWHAAMPIAAAALPYSQFARTREVCAIADEQHRNLIRCKYALAEFTGSLYLRERVIKEIPL